MQLEDLMSQNVTSVNSQDSLNVALSEMKKRKIHQIPVIDNGEYKGMLQLRALVTKRVNAERAKCGNFTTSTTKLKTNMNVREAAEILLNSGSRALPVMDGSDVVGIVSESDLMTLIEISGKASEIMTKCEYVSTDDNLGKVKKLMTYNNVSRVPVVLKNELVGVISTIHLIDVLLRAKQQYQSGGRMLHDRAKESQPIDKIKAETVMNTPKIISKDASINDVAKILQEQDQVFIMDSVPHVITQKDVLETLLPKKQEGVYVQIMNLHGEDSFDQAKIDSMTTTFVQKTGKIIKNMQSLIIHIEKYKKGGRTKYSVRTRLFPGTFVSHAWEWNLVTATQSALDKLEKTVKKEYGKYKERSSRKYSKEMLK